MTLHIENETELLKFPSRSVKVSVVVPSYNHAPFIEKTLRSIMRQTFAPSELLVIDDGSKDNSPQIIERVLKRCTFPCEFIVRSNKGLCATLNEGLAKTTSGDYFAYLGSDDAWLPEFLSSRVPLLESRPDAVLGYGHAYIINELDQIVECTLDWAQYVDGDARRMLLMNTAPLSSTVLYRRSALERHGWNEAARLEDYELYLRLSGEGDFAFDPRVLSVWRQHSYNTSRNLKMMIEACVEAQRLIGPSLGLSVGELERTHAAIRWRYAEDFIRNGDKRGAVSLLIQNFRGAPSVKSVARILARLLTPHSVLQRRKKLMQHRASEKYRRIEL